MRQGLSGQPAWRDCVGRAAGAASDAELFYAGYWLAKSGDYAAALEYLRRAQAPDARILTYIGFATRKLGDTDSALGYYARALAKNPDYNVARAYLGEAFLTKGEPQGEGRARRDREALRHRLRRIRRARRAHRALRGRAPHRLRLGSAAWPRRHVHRPQPHEAIAAADRDARSVRRERHRVGAAAVAEERA